MARSRVVHCRTETRPTNPERVSLDGSYWSPSNLCRLASRRFIAESIQGTAYGALTIRAPTTRTMPRNMKPFMIALGLQIFPEQGLVGFSTGLRSSQKHRSQLSFALVEGQLAQARCMSSVEVATCMNVAT